MWIRLVHALRCALAGDAGREGFPLASLDFAELSGTLAARGARNPDALAAWIGHRKPGAARGRAGLSRGQSLAASDAGIYLAEPTKDEQGHTLTCPECGHVAPSGDFGASGTSLTTKPGVLRTPQPSTGSVRSGAVTTVRSGNAAHALASPTRDAISLATGTLTARRHADRKSAVWGKSVEYGG